MKKELKEYIKTHKLSDDDILKLLQSPPKSEEETDVLDEADDSEDVAESEEQQHAERASAQQEKPKGGTSPTDLTKMINDAIAAAFKAERDAQLMPAQKPISYEMPKVKRSEPKPRTTTQTDAVVDSNGQLIW